MTTGIFTWLIIGLTLYLFLARRGGMMGCRGDHNRQPPGHSDRSETRFGHPSSETRGEIVDLKKEDYHILN